MTATVQTRRRSPYPYAPLINRSAHRNGIDAFLLAALLWVESGFNPHAVSNTGDVGIAQINLKSHPGVSAAEAHNPNFAIPWAARYLAELKTQTGSTTGALRAYNTGSGASSPKGNHYARTVLGARKEMRKNAHTGRASALSAAGFGRVDQGVDYVKAGAIPSLAPGVITHVGPETDIEGTRGNVVVEKLTAGKHKGQYVYVAENFRPTVRQGQRVRAGQQIGIDRGTTPAGGPGIEIGFNRTATGWNPVAPLGKNTGAPTSAGEQMLRYIQARSHGGAVPVRNVAYAGPKGPKGPVGPKPKKGGGGSFWGTVWSGLGTGAHYAGLGVGTGLSLAGLPNPFSGNNPVSGALGFGSFLGRIVGDPGYIVLWFGFAVVGLAFIFLGVERLLGRSASHDARGMMLVTAAPAAAAVGGAA